jgi:hypothetical protein
MHREYWLVELFAVVFWQFGWGPVEATSHDFDNTWSCHSQLPNLKLELYWKDGEVDEVWLFWKSA